MELKEFFTQYPKAALAFSGGVDSAYLLYAAVKYGADVRPYFVKSQFQPAFEMEDASRLAAKLGIELKVLQCDALADDRVAANPQDRCYHCKNNIFGLMKKAAAADGYSTILDGTNASDEQADRPGMKALAEMRVVSPLRLCGLTKEEIRRRSKEAGLFTWNKPSYACLATRVPTGEAITEDKLAKVEAAETALSRLGYTDFRVRLFGSAARLQLTGEQLEKAAAERGAIRESLRPYFEIILLDTEER